MTLNDSCTILQVEWILDFRIRPQPMNANHEVFAAMYDGPMFDP